MIDTALITVGGSAAIAFSQIPLSKPPGWGRDAHWSEMGLSPPSAPLLPPHWCSGREAARGRGQQGHGHQEEEDKQDREGSLGLGWCLSQLVRMLCASEWSQQVFQKVGKICRAWVRACSRERRWWLVHPEKAHVPHPTPEREDGDHPTGRGRGEPRSSALALLGATLVASMPTQK